MNASNAVATVPTVPTNGCLLNARAIEVLEMPWELGTVGT
jgi:hypothetical protein